MSQSAIIAIIIVSVELGVLCVYLNEIYKKVVLKIGENSLKNSQIDLLQTFSLRLINENKHLKVERDEAMNDAVRLHKSINKMSKTMQNGTGIK